MRLFVLPNELGRVQERRRCTAFFDTLLVFFSSTVNHDKNKLIQKSHAGQTIFKNKMNYLVPPVKLISNYMIINKK